MLYQYFIYILFFFMYIFLFIKYNPQIARGCFGLLITLLTSYALILNIKSFSLDVLKIPLLYTIIDIGLILIFYNLNKNIDMIIHHIVMLLLYGGIYIYGIPDDYIYLALLVLTGEMMPFFSAFVYNSTNKIWKLYRLLFIMFYRIPLWMYSLYNIYFVNKSIIKIISIISQIFILFLDIYWSDKMIKQYYNS